MPETCYRAAGTGTTSFFRAEKKVWLSRLFGMACGFGGRDEGPFRSRGLFLLDTDRGRFEADDLQLAESSLAVEQARFLWQTADAQLQIESCWRFDVATGIWSRRDILRNAGAQEVTIRRCLARFVFSPGHYEIYTQASRWCSENQGQWRSFDHGSVVLRCESGRTIQGGTPYLGLRDAKEKLGVAFHVLPRGNWVIRLNALTSIHNAMPAIVVEMGLADEDLHLRLPPQSALELPEILIQALPEAEAHLAAPQLHRYLLAHQFAQAKRVVPVIYNTWFDDFEVLRVERLRQQLAAAKELECEVFCVDAGWYGAGSGNWFDQAGDWREKPDAAFKGRMADFANEVRAAGLGFGLWCEIERIGPDAPILKQHPDWFVRTQTPFCYPDFRRTEVRDHIRAEIRRLIETYTLAWLKIDFNFELHPDPARAELSGYYAAWWELLDDVRRQYPHVFFEGCASGGMRSDLVALSHFDDHFLTDTVNPHDVLRIYQGALLRLLPGRLGLWTVLRAIGQPLPKYGVPLETTPVRLAAPSGAHWEPSYTVELDFAARVALCGAFGLSGDVASFPEPHRARMRQHVRFFKQWREFIAGAIAHLLTPPAPKEDRTGWAAVQLQSPRETTSLLFAYRLEDGSARQLFRLRELSAERRYSVLNTDQADVKTTFTGAQLMQDGIEVHLGSTHSAAVLVIAPEG